MGGEEDCVFCWDAVALFFNFFFWGRRGGGSGGKRGQGEILLDAVDFAVQQGGLALVVGGYS